MILCSRCFSRNAFLGWEIAYVSQIYKFVDNALFFKKVIFRASEEVLFIKNQNLTIL